MTLRETALVLNEGITIKGKSLREHFEATNHKAAILELEKIIRKKERLNEEVLLRIHRMILGNIDDRYAGVYRREQVRIIGARMIPPSPLKVERLMKEFFEWFNGEGGKINSIERSALVHYRLVEIHPFIDGNGRTSRLIMNLLLMQNGFPPAIILKNDRKKYYDVLNQANMGDLEPFILFIAQSVERSLGLYLEAIVPKIKPSDEAKEYISLKEAAQFSRYSQGYLGLMARRGKIHAIKRGRNWLTTREALADYQKLIYPS